jgi:hypothetical protein
MYRDTATKFRNRPCTQGEQAKKIPAASVEYVRIEREMIKMPRGMLLRTRIDQADGVIARSGMVNVDLMSQGIDISVPEQLILVGKTQAAMARGLMIAGDTREATLELVKFRKTVLSLRDAYRAILTGEILPEGSAQGVFSVARSLELAGSHMGASDREHPPIRPRS